MPQPAQPAPQNSNTKGLLGLKPTNVTVNRYDSGSDKDRIEITITNFQLPIYTPLIAKVYMRGRSKHVGALRQDSFPGLGQARHGAIVRQETALDAARQVSYLPG